MMSDHLWRLAWALPLVLLLGLVIVLLLKRHMAGRLSMKPDAQRMVVRESMSVSIQTQLHLIEVESAGGTQVQAVSRAHTDGTVLAMQLGAPWLRRLPKRA
jgi:flagellar biogenesis protein FliO